MIKREFSQGPLYNINGDRVKSGVKKKGDFEMRRICLVLVFVIVVTVVEAGCAYTQPKTLVQRRQERRQERLERFQNKYPHLSLDVLDTIESGKVFLGMQKDLVIMSWGIPRSINKTTASYGAHEQWVYSIGNYLYFEDGILTTIQN